jgi:diacylglycerol kinase family enzyme
MVVILNASASSTARDPSTRSKVSALFGAAGAYPRIIVGEGRDVQAIARQAVAADERTIVAGGGDGRHLFSSVTTNTR